MGLLVGFSVGEEVGCAVQIGLQQSHLTVEQSTVSVSTSSEHSSDTSPLNAFPRKIAEVRLDHFSIDSVGTEPVRSLSFT